MKLRNKKTGEITTRIDVSESGEKFWVLGKKPCMFDTLAELNAEWEDYKPADPLIKDGKIRKAVRAWAEANGFDTARYSSVNDCFCHQGNMMFVEPSYELEQLDSLGYKTIAELCGEEDK